MGDVFNGFGDMATEMLQRLTEAALNRALELAADGRFEQALGALSDFDVRTLTPLTKAKVGRIYYEMAKRMLWRREMAGAQQPLLRAKEFGMNEWLVEQRLQILNRPIRSSELDQALSSADNVERFIVPPEKAVVTRHLNGLFAMTVYRWQGDIDAADALSTLIRQLKRVSAGRVATVLAILLARRISESYPDLTGADLVVPVPADPDRTRERGFDNVRQLAMALSRVIALPHAEDILVKSRSSPDLRRIPRRQRRSALRGVFQIDPRRSARLHQTKVLLVDDVVTSGATLDCCAEVLKRGGAAEVLGCVVARSESSLW